MTQSKAYFAEVAQDWAGIRSGFFIEALPDAADPQAAIAEMARILKPGGKLMLTDLDTHEEVWMREAMADRWLGCERQNVRRWYAAAGLQKIDIDCAAGSCDCLGPEQEDISLSIFVANGQKPER